MARNPAAAKPERLDMAAKAGTDVQLMEQSWERHIHLVRGNTFRQRALFQADSSLCAQGLHTDD